MILAYLYALVMKVLTENVPSPTSTENYIYYVGKNMKMFKINFRLGEW